MKQSKNIYRTIKGVKFEQVTSDPSEFEALKKECKDKGLKFRIVNGDFLRGVFNTGWETGPYGILWLFK